MLDALHIDKVTVLGISSGGPSAVHFAARHPSRTNALLLDAAVLLPIAPASNEIERAIFESGTGIWLSCQMAKRWPKLTAALVVDTLSAGLVKDRKRDAVDWITSDPARLHNIVDLPTSLAPRRFRETGQRNDESNETNLDPLPFAEITAPTLIAQGTNDVFPLIDHATNAADKMPGAELMLVEEGHHGLPWCRHIGAVVQRQLELSLA
jgi:pimeloyl-ACP methyl ester carboxylesterase